jgi:hypothetical protein
MQQKGFWLKLGVLVAVEALPTMAIHQVVQAVIQKEKLIHQPLVTYTQ